MEAPRSLGDEVRALALSLGFSRVGFAAPARFEEAESRARDWVLSGHHGDMAYLEPVEPRADPRMLLPTARTVIVVALSYGGDEPVSLRRSRDDPTRLGPPQTPSAAPDAATRLPRLEGVVARYAVGADYHHALKHRLVHLARGIEVLVGRPVSCRSSVDTAPILEREAARRAGIGFVGKSGFVIAPRAGSFVLLGALLVDVELPPDEPDTSDCGRCTACLDACPTGAFVGPYVLDARRCIAYLTIENTGPIPRELRAKIGNRVLGCDVCQDVCPHNHGAEARPYQPLLGAREELLHAELLRWLELGAADYRKLVRRSALRRVGKRQLQRNAAVALGNSGDPRAIVPLTRVLERDPSGLVREHAAWALGRLGGPAARAPLERAAELDPDEGVRREARLSLEECDG